jgi:hypothetical protein
MFHLMSLILTIIIVASYEGWLSNYQVVTAESASYWTHETLNNYILDCEVKVDIYFSHKMEFSVT